MSGESDDLKLFAAAVAASTLRATANSLSAQAAMDELEHHDVDTDALAYVHHAAFTAGVDAAIHLMRRAADSIEQEASVL